MDMQPFNHKTQAKSVGKAAWKVFEGLNGCVGARLGAVSGSTDITYYLPEDAKQGMIVIADTETGRVLKRVTIDGPGQGKLTVHTENLSTGTYTYTLVIDGQQSLSRQMVLRK